MMKVKRITAPLPNDNRDIETKLNRFFEEHYITKDHIVNISMDSKPEYISFYVFYDYGEDVN